MSDFSFQGGFVGLHFFLEQTSVNEEVFHCPSWMVKGEEVRMWLVTILREKKQFETVEQHKKNTSNNLPDGSFLKCSPILT